jgi:hypothetical protein
VSACDIDLDGRDDILHRGSAAACLFLANSSGTLRPPHSLLLPAGGTTFCLDLNLDGLPDLGRIGGGSGCSTAPLSAHLNLGSGCSLPDPGSRGFVPYAFSLPEPFCSETVSSMGADLPSGRLHFLGASGTIFGVDVTPAGMPGGPPHLALTSTSSIPGSAFYARDILMGNLNGDTHPDAVVQRFFGLGVPPVGSAELVFLEGTPTGLAPSSTLVPIPLTRVTELTLFDADGDGLDDIVTNDLAAGVTIWFNTGTGTFTPVQLVPRGLGPLCPGDYDGDGDQDIAAYDGAAGGVTFYVNDGTGNFTLDATTIPVPPSGNPFNTPATVTCGDVNGDGRADLIFGAIDAVIVRINQGTPSHTLRPGSPDGLLLESAVETPGLGSPIFSGGALHDVKTARMGDILHARMTPPPLLSGGVLWLAAEPFVTACPPMPIGQAVWVSASSSTIVLGPLPCPVAASPVAFTFPLAAPGSPGTSLLVQVAIASLAASNQVYATSDAHEFQF